MLSPIGQHRLLTGCGQLCQSQHPGPAQAAIPGQEQGPGIIAAMAGDGLDRGGQCAITTDGPGMDMEHLGQRLGRLAQGKAAPGRRAAAVPSHRLALAGVAQATQVAGRERPEMVPRQVVSQDIHLGGYPVGTAALHDGHWVPATPEQRQGRIAGEQDQPALAGPDH